LLENDSKIMHPGKAKIGARFLPGFGDIGLDKNRRPKSKNRRPDCRRSRKLKQCFS